MKQPDQIETACCTVDRVLAFIAGPVDSFHLLLGFLFLATYCAFEYQRNRARSAERWLELAIRIAWPKRGDDQ